MARYLISESVTEGHPDKVADKISDAIVDAYLAKEPDARVAVETVVKEGLISLQGEISAPFTLHHGEIARKAAEEIGYTDADSGLDPRGAGIINNVWPRDFSSDLGDFGQEDASSEEEKEHIYDTFVGDQGLVVGYATDEPRNICRCRTSRPPNWRSGSHMCARTASSRSFARTAKPKSLSSTTRI